ncbi:hypothetical protein LEMLEM_LOCUS8393, partial [Lemmus lemmus]
SKQHLHGSFYSSVKLKGRVILVPRSFLQLFCKRTENRQLAVSAVTMEPDEREDRKGREKSSGGPWRYMKPSLLRAGLPRGEKGRAGVPGDERIQCWVHGLIGKLLADTSTKPEDGWVVMV